MGKEKVLLTKEERQALKLRELYADPKTTPRGEVTIEGDLLLEYKAPQVPVVAEAKPEDHPRSFVEIEGKAIPLDDTEEISTEASEATEKASPAADAEGDGSNTWLLPSAQRCGRMM